MEAWAGKSGCYLDNTRNDLAFTESFQSIEKSLVHFSRIFIKSFTVEKYPLKTTQVELLLYFYTRKRYENQTP